MSTTPARLGTVVVAGGSVAGLLSAAAVSRHADRVVVLERDFLPDTPAPRPGTPQAIHTHGLLPSGRFAMDALLPGFTDALVEAGAHADGDVGIVGRWWVGGGLVAECETGAGGVAVSRLLLEHTLRSRVAALPTVEIRTATDVARLTAHDGRVTGVVARDRDADPAERVIESDLVVDATGRAGRAHRWLPAIGATPPDEERIEIGIRYVTTHVKAVDGDVGDRMFVISAATPEVPRGAVAIRQEDATWTLTLFAYGDEPVPLDADGLRRAAENVVAAEVATLLDDREPLHDALAYRFPDCRRRAFERLRDLPFGYAAVGDAICSLDPTFGHGMSLAAMQAVALGRAVGSGGLDEVRARYPREAARIVDGAWTIVRGADLQLPGVVGTQTRADVLIGRYVRRLQRVARRDPVVAAALLRVTALVARPESLLAPHVAARVLASRGAR
ncbi:FAD-binding protein [Mumia sp. ZJ1417]|uniref:NAD(P)/FAD-dependent oxidoreductase n=1 Tax=Mumia sp. ZJ1417 TaxID=2708082 RepID=UPI00142363C2|nr:FAD-binding protein [Mumia sp. ZJ1417]QMW67525.1 FAD-binding protein [Mumia sp. ZJ1417]